MSTVRRVAGAISAIAAGLIVVGVFLQVYFIASFFFGAGPDALDAHKNTGLVVHSLEIVVFVAALVAWLSRTDLLLALALAVIGTVQVALADAHKWAGGFHGFFALVVLALAGTFVRRALAARSTTVAASGRG